MGGDGWALLGIALVVGAGIVWFRLMNAVRIPHNRSPFFVAMGIGSAAAAVGLAQGTSWLGSLAAWLAIAMTGIFVILRAQSGQAPNRPAVEVGGPILDFTLDADAGGAFDLASLRGKPYLLKFFRGHW